jgi:DNA-binding HxlR family transcriptional regulator
MNQKKSQVCPKEALLNFLSQSHMLTVIHTIDTKVWGFSDLYEKTGINTRTLTKRLLELTEQGIVEKVDCPQDKRCQYYRLSKKGRQINTAINTLP